MVVVEQGDTLKEAVGLIHAKYGNNARIINQRSIPHKGLAGLLGKERVEVSASISHTTTSASQEAKEKLSEQISTHTIKPLLDEMRMMQKKIDHLSARERTTDATPAYPKLKKLEDILFNNGFSHDYISYIAQRARSFFSVEHMENEQRMHGTVLQWISDDIQIQNWQQACTHHITVLIGPTGVGKTTTLAKIAKILGYNDGRQKVADIAMLTIDNYRLAAKEQLEGYGRTMGYPVHMILSQDDLNAQIKRYKSYNHILIDTIGRSPQEATSLGEMRDLLSPIYNKINTILLISATTKYNDIKLILRHYEPFEYNAIIVTKVDETRAVGAVLSALRDVPHPIIFLSTGQRVPLDIVPATRACLLAYLEGFAIDSGSIEQLLTSDGMDIDNE